MGLKQKKWKCCSKRLTTCCVDKGTSAILDMLILLSTVSPHFSPQMWKIEPLIVTMGENVGQFACRAFRNYTLWEVQSAGIYVSKGKRAPKRSTQKDDPQIHSTRSLSPLEIFCFLFFLLLCLPEEVLVILKAPTSNLTSFVKLFLSFLLSQAKLGPYFSQALSS